MSRPLTRTQALQNRAFLKLLRRTGNVRLACREVGLKYGTMQHRRKQHAHFAAAWDAAVVFAQVGLAGKYGSQSLGHGSESHDHVGRVRLPFGSPARRPAGAVSAHNDASPDQARGPLTVSSAASFRTAGGEPVLRRTRNGKLQLQRAQPGKLTPVAEQAYLAALSATCNMALAAAAVGAAFNAFVRRRRKDPAFAREERMALIAGYEQLEMALLEAGFAGSHEHDDWRSNAPPPIPPMTANQALQLLYLHHKTARLNAIEPHMIRRRPREPEEVHHERLVQMAEARLQRGRDEFDVAEAARWERGEPAWGPAGEAVRRELGLSERGEEDGGGELGLPDLAQVTGWSRADPDKTPHDPRRALFGGWRMDEMERKLGRR